MLLGERDLRKHAQAVGLNVTQFDACLREGRFATQAGEDRKAGIEAGVSGTPGFFVNGVFLNGSQPLSAFEEIIDRELLPAKAHGN